MPQFIPYLVTGFLFCYVYRFASLKEKQKDIDHILIKSFVFGYIIYYLAKIIPHGKISDGIYPIIITVVSLVIAYIFAKIATSVKFGQLLGFLHIWQTGNDLLWDDIIIDPDYGVKAEISLSKKVFSGYIHYYEGHTSTPHVVLCLYKVKDQNGNVLEDYSKDPSVIITLNTADAESVKLEYANESIHTKDISAFLG